MTDRVVRSTVHGRHAAQRGHTAAQAIGPNSLLLAEVYSRCLAITSGPGLPPAPAGRPAGIELWRARARGTQSAMPAPARGHVGVRPARWLERVAGRRVRPGRRTGPRAARRYRRSGRPQRRGSPRRRPGRAGCRSRAALRSRNRSAARPEPGLLAAGPSQTRRVRRSPEGRTASLRRPAGTWCVTPEGARRTARRGPRPPAAEAAATAGWSRYPAVRRGGRRSGAARREARAVLTGSTARREGRGLWR